MPELTDLMGDAARPSNTSFDVDSARHRLRQRRRRRRLGAVGAVVVVAVIPLSGLLLRPDQNRSTGVVTKPPTTVSTTTTPSTTTTITITTTTTTTTTTALTVDAPLESVDWSRVAYPVDCDSFGFVIQAVAYIEPTPGTQIALVMVRCDVGAGSPSSALFAFDAAISTTEARLIQTLIDPLEDLHALDLANGGVIAGDALTVAVDVSGYSAPGITRATPDIQTTLTWQWDGTRYRLSSPVPEHNGYCVDGRTSEGSPSTTADCGRDETS